MKHRKRMNRLKALLRRLITPRSPREVAEASARKAAQKEAELQDDLKRLAVELRNTFPELKEQSEGCFFRLSEHRLYFGAYKHPIERKDIGKWFVEAVGGGRFYGPRFYGVNMRGPKPIQSFSKTVKLVSEIVGREYGSLLNIK